MPVELKIKVTKEILERTRLCGWYNERGIDVVQNCAVALAVRDIFPSAEVYGRSMNADISSLKLLPRILLPEQVVIYIDEFDKTHPNDRPGLPEIEFTISIPDEIIETIDIESLRPLLSNHPTLELL